MKQQEIEFYRQNIQERTVLEQHIVHSALQEVKGKEFAAVGIKMKGIKPLPIFKQIMTLFCDINEGMMGDNSLKDYLLDKLSV